jgi:hypothetical protein
MRETIGLVCFMAAMKLLIVALRLMPEPTTERIIRGAIGDVGGDAIATIEGYIAERRRREAA